MPTQHLTAPPQVCLCGRTAYGQSSLSNQQTINGMKVQPFSHLTYPISQGYLPYSTYFISGSPRSGKSKLVQHLVPYFPRAPIYWITPSVDDLLAPGGNPLNAEVLALTPKIATRGRPKKEQEPTALEVIYQGLLSAQELEAPYGATIVLDDFAYLLKDRRVSGVVGALVKNYAHLHVNLVVIVQSVFDVNARDRAVFNYMIITSPTGSPYAQRSLMQFMGMPPLNSATAAEKTRIRRYGKALKELMKRGQALVYRRPIGLRLQAQLRELDELVDGLEAEYALSTRDRSILKSAVRRARALRKVQTQYSESEIFLLDKTEFLKL